MKIGVYQFAPEFGEMGKNLDRIDTVLKNCGADLVVLPELCTTGYQFISTEEVHALSESVEEGETLKRWARLCAENQFFLVGGMSELDKGKCYNTSVLVGPDGLIGKYRKVHLFYEEREWFHPGDLGFPVFDIGPARVGMMICFDWLFPEAARSLALKGADMICHPVNLVLPYCQQAMVTRSIENGVFTITANRFGTEERGGRKSLTFTGGSQALDHKGNLLFQLGETNEVLQFVDIDPTLSRDKWITEHNHRLEDRRLEQYK